MAPKVMRSGKCGVISSERGDRHHNVNLCCIFRYATIAVASMTDSSFELNLTVPVMRLLQLPIGGKEWLSITSDEEISPSAASDTTTHEDRSGVEDPEWEQPSHEICKRRATM